MTDHERELLLMLAKSIHALDQDCARRMNRDPMANQSLKRRQELIELVEAEAYAGRIAAATRQVSQ